MNKVAVTGTPIIKISGKKASAEVFAVSSSCTIVKIKYRPFGKTEINLTFDWNLTEVVHNIAKAVNVPLEKLDSLISVNLINNIE